MSDKILDKFDPFAMVNPKSEDDLLLLARELRAEIERMAQHIEKAVRLCEQHKGKK